MTRLPKFNILGHVHFPVELSEESNDISKVIQGVKSFSARRIIDKRTQTGGRAQQEG